MKISTLKDSDNSDSDDSNWREIVVQREIDVLEHFNLLRNARNGPIDYVVEMFEQ